MYDDTVQSSGINRDIGKAQRAIGVGLLNVFEPAYKRSTTSAGFNSVYPSVGTVLYSSPRGAGIRLSMSEPEPI